MFNLSLDKSRFHSVWDEYGKKVFLCTAIAYITAYYYMMISEPVNADCLTLGFLRYHGGYWYDQIGRWGRGYAEALFYKINNPLVSHLICYLCICIAAVMLIDLWNIRGTCLRIIIGPLLAVSQAVVDTAQFSHDLLFYILSMLMAVAAAYLVSKANGIPSLIISVILTVASLSLYQPYLNTFSFTVAGTVLLKLLSDDHDGAGKTWQKITIRGLITGIGGCALYFVIWKVLSLVKNTPRAVYSGIDTIDSPRNIGLIWSEIQNAYFDFCRYYTNEDMLGINLIWSVLLLILLVCILILSVRRIKEKKAANLIAAAVLLLLFPVIGNPVCIIARSNGGPRGYFMCQLMIPLIAAMISGLSQEACISKKISQIISLAFILLSVFLFMGLWTRAYSSVRTWDIGDRTTRSYVQHALMHALEDERYVEGMPIVFMGVPDTKYAQEMNPLHEYAYNDPYVIWDSDKDMAILGDWRLYTAYYFGTDIGTITDTEYEDILESSRFEKMADYPSEQAYEVIDGKYVILMDRDTVGY